MKSQVLLVLLVALVALPRGRCFKLDLPLESLPPGPCRDHLSLFLTELRNLTTWAITMFDATGKFPSGILRGNLRQLGDYDECLTLNIEDHFKGHYCLVDLNITGIEHEVLDIMSAGRRHLELTRTQLRGPAVLPIFSRIQWAVCVPSSCSADDVQKVISHMFIPLKTTFSLELQANVSPENCYMATKVTLTNADYFILGIILLIMLLIISATVLDQLSLKICVDSDSETGHIRKLVDAFSVKKNWKLLWNVDSAGGVIACVDGIRALSTFWVVMTHKILQLSQEPWVNKVLMLESVQDFLKMPLLNSMLNVDSFFLVSGMLRSYNLMNQFEKNNFNMLRSMLQRFFRLTPAYAIVVGFYATLMVYLGSGPGWNQHVKQQSEYCRENWLFNFLYLNNYIGYQNMCMVQSWYLSADMQLFILAPLLVYPLWKWQRLGKVIFGLFMCISIIIPFSIILIYKFPGFYHPGRHDTQLGYYMQHIYMVTHNRMSPYIIGILTGYIMSKCQAINFKLHKGFVAAGWIISMLALLADVFGPYQIFQMDSKYNSITDAFYGAFHRPVWALALAWIIFACHKGYGGVVSKFLEAPFLRPFSHLSYSIYLTHIAVLLISAGRQRAPPFMDEYLLAHNYLGDMFIIIVAAIFLYIGFESPFLTITHFMFHNGKKKKQQFAKQLNINNAMEINIESKTQNSKTFLENSKL